jgi:predicted metal-dependent peptidase
MPDPKAAGAILGHQKFEGMSETAVRLMLRVPYIMVLYYSLTFYVTKLIRTLAVNGVACWINQQFWSQLTRDQRLTAVGHEIGHKMLLHPTRRGSRDPYIWNAAGDYVINLMLVESGFVPLTNLVIDGQPWSWLYDVKYKGMTTEQVYEALIKEYDDAASKKPKEPQPGQAAGPQGAGDGDDSESADDADDGEGEDGSGDGGSAGEADDGDDGAGEVQDADAGSNAAGGSVPGTGAGVRGPSTGTSAGNAAEVDGEDGDPADDGRSDGSRDAEAKLGPMRDLLDFGTDPEGNTYEDPERDAESPAQFEERMKQELAAAEQVAKMNGKTPGWMKRVMANAQHQKVPWPEIVEQYLKGLVQADYSWRRFSKRDLIRIGSISPDMYEPAMGGLLLLVDCSGSITGKILTMFGRHFRDVLEQVKPKWVEVVYFDTQPYPPYERFERAEFDEDTARLKPAGGGGTDFRWFAQYEENMDEAPEVVMCLTDLEGPVGRETTAPMLWLCTSSIEEARYGEVISIS